MSNVIAPSSELWDAFVRAHPRGHLLQLSTWGRHKRAFGWTDACVGVTDSAGALAGGALLLFRPLPMRLGTMAYLPMGPLVREPGVEAALWKAVHAEARRHRAAFLKWEPGLFDKDAPQPGALGFHESEQTIQPPRTVLIDIKGEEEAILGRMNQGTRRKIRQSLKGEVRYWEASAGEIDLFNSLMHTTGARNQFGVHSAEYYRLAYELFVPGDAALILAEHEGEPLAGIMVFAVGKTAWYLYGASSSVKRNLMASYGVQWRAIQWARARGCTTYDMWGIPDAEPAQLEAEFETRSDGLWGVYGFKRGWGGAIVRSLGAWDKVYNPLVYRAYETAVKLRERRHRADRESRTME
ncbi:MAG: peptidoglycan bridge formation glycyltransferase FemA/FemB family protein [Chloroflexi bacterium]|nr:peptidoglycan bridge formation glycyltransferase FemA/FemB family protein [Chloroflexota bacterium]